MPFLVIGLVTGSVYGIAALGLVVTYKTSGVFNFGYGAIAAGAACVFYALHVRLGAPWPVAAVVAVFVFGTLAGLVMQRLGRALSGLRAADKIVATVGVLLVIQGVATVSYGAEARDFPSFLPTKAVSIAGVYVGVDQMLVVAIAAASAVALFLVLARTTTGRAMRAVVDDPNLLDLTGIDPERVQRSSWVIGCCFASLSGVLIAPTIGLNAGLLTLLVVQAFGAAAIGLFRNLPATYAGGLIVGVVQAFAVKFVVSTAALQALPSSVPFLVLFLVLLFIPRGRLIEAGRLRTLRPVAVRAISRTVRLGGLVAGFAVLVAIPMLVGAKLPVYTTGLAQVLLFLSLGLLVRTSGQLSLCQIGFQAIGAAAFAHLSFDTGFPWLAALLVAGLIAVPVGALIAIPAIRLAPLYLALATFGFGILLAQVGYGTSLMFGTYGSLQAPRPDVLGLSSDKGYYYVILIVVLAGTGLVAIIQRSRLGRLLAGLSDSPTVLATSGASPNVTRLIVFCVASFMAGVSGALLSAVTGYVNSVSFPFFNSLLALAVLAISGRGVIRSAFVAAAALFVVPSYINSPTIVDWLPIVFGLVAIAAVTLAARDRTASGDQSRLSPGRRHGNRLTARHIGSTPPRTRIPAGRLAAPIAQENG